jgi:hypothetical protein
MEWDMKRIINCGFTCAYTMSMSEAEIEVKSVCDGLDRSGSIAICRLSYNEKTVFDFPTTCHG